MYPQAIEDCAAFPSRKAAPSICRIGHSNPDSTLADVLGDNLVRIEHIGSTVIPGIRAKPVVDLLPIVHSLSRLDDQQEAIARLGYAWWGEFHISGRRYCSLDDPHGQHRLFNVHFFETGSPHIERHLAFRDYLLAYPDQALEYEEEKVRAAIQHPTDVWPITQRNLSGFGHASCGLLHGGTDR